MKVILCLLVNLIPVLAFSQTKFTFSIDPIGIHLERVETRMFVPANFKFSLKSSAEGVFFEFQPGIILNGPILHTDFQIGLQNEVLFIKGGGFYFFNVSTGSMFSSAKENAFMLGMSIGIFAARNFFIESSFNPAFISIGLGYNL